MHVDTEPKLPQLLNVKGVMSVTSLSRATVYRAIQSGELKPLKFGRRVVFTKAHIAEWINSKVSQAA